MKLKLTALFILTSLAAPSFAQRSPSDVPDTTITPAPAADNTAPPNDGDQTSVDMTADANQPMDEPTTEPTATPDATAEQPSAASAPVAARRATTPRYSRNRRTRSQTSAGGASTAAPKRMAALFDVLTNRSIFVKGRQATSADNNTNGSNGNYAPATPSQPERSYIFNGVTKSDTATAMIENTDTRQISKLHVGDLIARGKITAITLNTIDYEVSGHVTRIEIGHTLAGGVVQSMGDALASPSGTGTTQPVAGPVGRQMGESIEAYLRRRRAMGF